MTGHRTVTLTDIYKKALWQYLRNRIYFQLLGSTEIVTGKWCW